MIKELFCLAQLKMHCLTWFLNLLLKIVLVSEETGAYRKIAASGYMIGQEKTRFESDTLFACTHVCK